jgi:undecaprenyl diphosphate synthase
MTAPGRNTAGPDRRHFDRRGDTTYNVRMFKDLDGFVAPGSEAERLVRQIDKERIPAHVAVIMDGNGRWAQARQLPRIEGQRAGIKSVKEIVETAARLGVQVLTLYAFSKENWKRPKREVSAVFRILEQYLKKEYKVLLENDLRLRVVGQREGLPDNVIKELDRVERLTRGNERMVVALALNYGGRTEILDAVKSILADRRLGPADIDEELFAGRLYTAGLPDPDLVIRTSGEMRISNFLLWQIAYAEIWTTPTYWPDFRRQDFFQAVLEYQKRERRFGDVRPPL